MECRSSSHMSSSGQRVKKPLKKPVSLASKLRASKCIPMQPEE
jgi:hypothetical protein